MFRSCVITAMTFVAWFHWGLRGQETAEFTAGDKVKIDQLFERYILAYNTRDRAKLRDCLQAPFALQDPHPTWVVLSTLDDVVTYYEKDWSSLDKAQYNRAFYERTSILPLTGERALVNKIYRFDRKDGTRLEEGSVFYILCKSPGAWKICGYLMQDLKNFGKHY